MPGISNSVGLIGKSVRSRCGPATVTEESIATYVTGNLLLLGRLLRMLTPLARRPACFNSTASPTEDRKVLDVNHRYIMGVFPFDFFREGRSF